MTEIAIMLSVFCSYLAYVVTKIGVPPSISDSWYELPGDFKHLFTVFILGLSIPMAEYGYDENNIWFFSSGAVLTFAGIAAEFKKKSVGWLHGTGAVGGIALATMGLITEKEYEWVAIATGCTLSIRYGKVGNETWWVEIVWFVCIVSGMISSEFRTSVN